MRESVRGFVLDVDVIGFQGFLRRFGTLLLVRKIVESARVGITRKRRGLCVTRV